MKPLVTVLIDTYNQERYIEQALVSVLEQGFPPGDMEIVVVDDGSTDNTAAVVAKFAPGVRYIRKENGGQASAFNAAIPETYAPIVAFLDADDWWAKGKLRAVLDAFEQNPGIAAVGHGFFEVKGSAPPDEYVVPERTCRIDLSSIEAIRTALAGRIFLGTSRLAVRRAALDRIGPIPEELVFCADTPILTLSLALGGAILLDQPLCYYRLHSENLFAFGAGDPAKVRRRYEIVECHLKVFPQRLAEMGVPPEAIAAFLERDRIEMEHFKLRFNGGSRRRTFRAEMRSFHSEYKNPSPGYVLFKWFVGATTLLLPPRRFYEMRDWYARRSLKRIRSFFGDAELVHPQSFVQRRKIAPAQLASPVPATESASQAALEASQIVTKEGRP